MDTTKTTTHVSLCAGYGGIDLGLKRAVPSLRTVAFSEIEAFACANLVSKMEAGHLDPAPIWTDLKTFPWAEFRDRVDILSGGYPCQPFSAAGKRLGKDDPRHLWPWIADGIQAMRPRLCFFENVEGHISLGLRDVVEELASIGYQTTWGIFSAAEVGAPHQRKRVFILAHLHLTGLEGLRASVDGFSLPKDGSGQSGQIGVRSSHPWPSRPGQPQHEWEPPRVVGDTESQRSAAFGAKHEGLGWELCAASASGQGVVGDTVQSRSSSKRSSQREQNGSCESSDELGNTNSTRPQERQGQRGSAIQGVNADGGEDASRQAEPALGRDIDGPPGGLGYAELCVTCDNRTDELRLLGNGVVPATAELAFRTLCHELVTTQ